MSRSGMPSAVGGDAPPLGRREFLARAGVLGIGAVLLRVRDAAAAQGWLDEVAAQDLGLTRDTISGLIAFVVPGPDAYSIAQGQASATSGGIDAKGADNLIQNLDAFIPAPALGPFGQNGTVPVSGAVASMLNAMAAQVDPVAAGGPFPSHFSRLSFASKAEVFRRLDATEGDDDLARTIRYVALAVLGLAAYSCYNDWHTFDPETRMLSGRPVGWELARYYPGRTTPADGWPELRGYYKGRKTAHG